jgi:lipoprotein NlpD
MTVTRRFDRFLRLFLSCSALAVLAACATSKHPAPVEERGLPAGRSTAPAGTAGGDAAPQGKPPLNAENAGKPGYYTVRPGDTLIRVGLETGQNWRDIQKWNNIENPNVLEVGQVLRVVAPGIDPSAAATRGIASTRIESKPLDIKPAASAPAAPSAPAASSTPATPAATSAPAAAPQTAAASSGTTNGKDDDDLNWLWPAQGNVVGGFEEARNKGISIAGKAGDPVVASADGRVVYAGSGLRGYGNLVIIKHNDTFLTAYAHNQTLLVKEDQAVKRGQKIAEMGSTDADRVMLHFEIRRRGKPVDPTRLLPAR